MPSLSAWLGLSISGVLLLMARCPSSQETQLRGPGKCLWVHSREGPFNASCKLRSLSQSWGNGLWVHNMGTLALIERIWLLPHFPSVIVFFFFFQGTYKTQAVFFKCLLYIYYKMKHGRAEKLSIDSAILSGCWLLESDRTVLGFWGLRGSSVWWLARSVFFIHLQ